jgi:flavin reductase (DIM6/NTAB) family NADH-FMN oxidoreductase RutF
LSLNQFLKRRLEEILTIGCNDVTACKEPNGMKHSETRNFGKISPEILYFGTPVAVISSLNADGTTNLAAMSSFWALDDRFLLGLTSYGQTAANLERWSECVLNFPSPSEWEHVERLGHTTGRVHLLRYHHKAGIVHACLTSAPVGQIGRIEERRIFGSS